MTKKMISWLSFMAVFLFLLHSCVHDEIYSSSDPASAEYHSKSLWKEDEKYIKNVMKIYSEHEDNIKKFSGTPDWDYAMSMGRYDESFMVVPIIENGKVVNTLACARFDKKVYFRYENSETNEAFFQNIIYGKYTRYKTEADNTKTNTQKGIVCITKTISMWYPDNESNPNAGGYWETNYYTNCYNFLDYSGPGWEDNGGGGYDYGGGGGSGNNDPNNPNNQTPCEKTKNIINNTAIKAKIDDLKTKSTGSLENAYKFKADGTTSNLIVGGKHEVDFGDKTGFQGGYHNHTTGTEMFSPADIEQLLQFALAQGNYGDPSNAFLGMVAPNGFHYVMYFNGNYQDALTSFSQNEIDEIKKDFQTRYGLYNSLGQTGLEKLFFSALKDMNLEGKVTLQRIDNNGMINTIIKNNDGTRSDIPCS
ncbi:hypothetical protein QX233_10345 [Chryseobacterium gambrini]|uniref:Uncharacterized protein n=1 Tax=Chryseobacterium gambrini TaxID=373672 RepID=A0AAJ1R7C1_9FLAO|nr:MULTISPECIES: hypothetical protein [Chryseobacterium]MDN4012863.1 hypothetical protein [Chryseobacterium gambrini]MDN4030628.1 hypothetical protein [Chryseobacterium gambrini]QWA36598.1 hypothetical protein KKI44_11605 [Chryseobacterium sp. ZHDP1]